MRGLSLWALLLLLALGSCSPGEGLLFPYGLGRGDEALEAGDDVSSAPLSLDTPLHFYGSSVHSLYVSAPETKGKGREGDRAGERERESWEEEGKEGPWRVDSGRGRGPERWGRGRGGGRQGPGM